MDINVNRDIYKWVRDRRLVDRLERDPRLLSVGSTFHLQPTPGAPLIKLRGLTKVLGRQTWPQNAKGAARHRRLNHDNVLITDGPDMTTRGAREIAEARRHVRAMHSASGAARGNVLGSLVHKQIEDLLKLNHDAFMAEHPHGKHPLTDRVMEAILARGWTPRFAEFLVADEEAGVGTAIDMLAFDRNGRAIFIELKTGYAGTVFLAVPTNKRDVALRGRGARGAALWKRMRLQNSAYDRARLQLLLGVAMAARRYDLQPGVDYEAWVLRVDDTMIALNTATAAATLDFLKLSSRMFTYQNAALAALRACGHADREESTKKVVTKTKKRKRTASISKKHTSLKRRKRTLTI